MSAKGSVSSSQRAVDDSEKTYSLIEDDERNIWSGFVTRNKQNRVLMDAYLVSGSHMDRYLTDQEHNLNITHLTTLQSMDLRHLEG